MAALDLTLVAVVLVVILRLVEQVVDHKVQLPAKQTLLLLEPIHGHVQKVLPALAWSALVAVDQVVQPTGQVVAVVAVVLATRTISLLSQIKHILW
jgi:hypothetical protein